MISSAFWLNNQERLLNKIKSGNLADFLTWDFICHTMFHELHSNKFNALKNSKVWNTWKDAIKEDAFGNPKQYHLYPQSSGNLLHHAHSLWQFSEFATNFDLSALNAIFEFGCGYGSLCRLFYRLGFNGKYTLYDLPAFSELQRHFLQNVNVDLNNLQFINSINEKNEVDMFIAMWSISECPIALRDVIFSKIEPRYYLIIYQHAFDGIDNQFYFNRLMESKSQYRWTTYQVPEIENSFYLFGEKI